MTSTISAKSCAPDVAGKTVCIDFPRRPGWVQPQKFTFSRRDELFQYVRAMDVAGSLMERSFSVIASAIVDIERMSRRSENSRRHFEPWVELLNQPASDIMLRLLAASTEGEVLRGCMPFFFLWDADDINRLSAETSRLWRKATGEKNGLSTSEEAWLDRIAVDSMRMSVDEDYRDEIEKHLS